MRKKISSIIFDLDGTLIHSIPDVHASLNYALKNLGLRTLGLEEVLPLVGRGPEYLIKNVLMLANCSNLSNCFRQEFQKEYIQYYQLHPCDYTTLYPGVLDLLDYCAANCIQLGVCTNKPSLITRILLDALQIGHYFLEVVCGNEVKYQKPDLRHIELVINKLGVKKEEAVMVGDSEHDINAANNLGIFSVLVHDQEAMKNCRPDLFFKHFIDFKHYIMGE